MLVEVSALNMESIMSNMTLEEYTCSMSCSTSLPWCAPIREVIMALMSTVSASMVMG